MPQLIGCGCLLVIVFFIMGSCFFTSEHSSNEKSNVENCSKPIPPEVQKCMNRYGKQPTLDQWNGEYVAIRKYLALVAKDPDSVKIYRTSATEPDEIGWRVVCDWGAKNSFGAMERSITTFYIRNDQVFKAE